MTTLRKVQLTGTSTLSVSLPSDWTKRFKVHRGTEVRLVEGGDGSLIVRPTSSETAPTERQLDLSQFTDAQHLRRAFLAAYLSGADVIRFHSSQKISAAKRRVIVDQAHMLIGVEVTEETANLILVQDFFSHEGLSVSKTLKRAHALTCSMFEQLLEGLDKGDASSALELLEKDDDVDRLRFLLLRQLNLALENATLLHELGLSAPDCVNYVIVMRNVEGVADKISTVARYQAEIPNASSKNERSPVGVKLAQIGRDSYVLYQQTVKSFFSSDFQLANETIESQTKLLESRLEFEKLLAGQRGKLPSYQYSVMLDALMDIGEHATEIAEATIDSSYEPANKPGAKNPA